MCDYSADIVRSKLIFTTFSANAKDVKLARIFLCIRNLILDVIAHEKVNFVIFRTFPRKEYLKLYEHYDRNRNLLKEHIDKKMFFFHTYTCHKTSYNFITARCGSQITRRLFSMLSKL